MKTTTKVLHVISGLETGGAETMLYKVLSKSSSDLNAVLCLGEKKETPISKKLDDLGVNIYWMDMKAYKFKLLNIFFISQVIKTFKPNIVHGWMYYGNLLALICKLFSGSILVIWNVRHSLHDLKSDKFLTRLIIKLNSLLSSLPNSIIYNSKTSAKQHEVYGFSINKTCIIPNGFDMSLFKPDDETRKRLRYELDMSQDDFVIGCVARYHPTKGHEVLLGAASILVTKFPNVKFLLVGNGLDVTNHQLVEKIKTLDLLKNVILLGERNDVTQLTSIFDVATSASLSEAFSNTIGEAMACAVPCVVTDVGDSAWIVGDFGKVVPSENSIAMSNAWKELIDMEIDQRNNLGLMARNRMLENFSINSIVERYDQLYEASLAN